MSKERIQVAFASGSEDLHPTLIESMRRLAPDVPLYIVSEFAVEGARWVPWYPSRGYRENLARLQALLVDKQIVFCGLILQPRMPYWKMRAAAFALGGMQTVFFNENLNHFMLRPGSAGTIARHFLWRTKNFVRWELKPGGSVYTFLWRLAHPWAFARPLAYVGALAVGGVVACVKAILPARRVAVSGDVLPEGISVVIPSRNGRELLARLLPGLTGQIGRGEIIVVDNGSDDGTAEWLRAKYPHVLVVVVRNALSFAAAINTGVRKAQFSHVCFLNNDMVLEPGFFEPLRQAFDKVPKLFGATAQILFPEGVRREETGKAVMPFPEWRKVTDFPVRCDLPFDGEDLSYVLYGSGGCTLFDTRKLRALGSLDEGYSPAYVEDLDLGYRGWLAGWPTVFVAQARVLHLHRSTTSRYYTEDQLARVLERNHLRFVVAAASSPRVFWKMWREAVGRLNHIAAQLDAPLYALPSLARAMTALGWVARPLEPVIDEQSFMALASGAVTNFPGRAVSGKPRVLIAAPYIPFPLSHGGAVRMYNLMRRGAEDFDQVLLIFTDDPKSPPQEVLDICVEVVQVRRVGTHLLPKSTRPDVVEEFASPAFEAALRALIEKWKPGVVQLEFTQMAQYARVCAPARTLLVEHDVTLDLYAQLLKDREDYETRRQYEKWVAFETAAWRDVDAVVTMSEKDKRGVTGAKRVESIANGVDLERFVPSAEDPEPGRILFLGSFAHLPNIMAIKFFLDGAWPLLAELKPTLHVIAGSRHKYFLDHYRDRIEVDLSGERIEVEDFVSDVRPAYRRASIVIAPLVASAGTNIKIMEAMAMGKAIVSTPAGINGLDELVSGRDVLVTPSAQEMAGAIRELILDAAKRTALEKQARATAEAVYSWDAIAKRQKALYEALIAARTP